MLNRLDPKQWVAAHADYLYAYAITRVNDEDQAKDLVQETFLAALQKTGGFEGRSTERTWLTAILRNKIVDVYRKRSKASEQVAQKNGDDQQTAFFDEDSGHWITGNAPKAFGIEHDDHLVKKEFESILKKCMEKLPVLWKAVFTMKHIDEEATETICAEMKVTQANFWVIIHRAKLNLRACLQKNWI
jgi:RNA polymerase sigma-70 factor (TIGR02943 family)